MSIVSMYNITLLNRYVDSVHVNITLLNRYVDSVHVNITFTKRVYR